MKTKMEDEFYYLRPGFDPSSLRAADLRRIFVFYDVDYPSSAKKSALVSIFKDQIAPRAQKLLESSQADPEPPDIEYVPGRNTQI